MKKQLNTAAVINELKGGSVFFRSEAENGQAKPRHVAPPPPDRPPQPDKFVTTPPASAPASRPASEQDGLLEEIRKAVKVQGREVAYVRLTQEEKNKLADIIYTYKRQGIKTTETEIGRIAINYLMEDYRANGRASVLARLLAILNA
jgi:hypothetical protein